MIHMAGPLENGVQRCTYCSRVLVDYRNIMRMDGFYSEEFVGWEVGQRVDIRDGVGQDMLKSGPTSEPANCYVEKDKAS